MDAASGGIAESVYNYTYYFEKYKGFLHKYCKNPWKNSNLMYNGCVKIYRGLFGAKQGGKLQAWGFNAERYRL